ncbi:MAG: FAD-dependent oxidoreductase [Patescibacteria group bacterium]|jgi:ferredoxin-NADP reductase
MLAKLKNRELIADNTLMATFSLTEKIDFMAGQFAVVSLIDPPYQDDKGSDRYFSINNSPSHNQEITIATRLSDSAFKKSLNEMPLGSELEIKSIGGNFTLPKNQIKPLTFITGGIGITPFMSMLRYIRENDLDYNLTMFYFNRTQTSTAFLSELQKLSQEIKNFYLILIMTDDKTWPGEKEKVTPELIKKYLPDWTDNTFMMAGPPAMVEGVSKTLSEMGIKKENVLTEIFTGY